MIFVRTPPLAKISSYRPTSITHPPVQNNLPQKSSPKSRRVCLSRSKCCWEEDDQSRPLEKSIQSNQSQSSFEESRNAHTSLVSRHGWFWTCQTALKRWWQSKEIDHLGNDTPDRTKQAKEVGNRIGMAFSSQNLCIFCSEDCFVLFLGVVGSNGVD